MRLAKNLAVLAWGIASVLAATSYAQQSRRGIPSVSDLVKRLDANGDGTLGKAEVSKPPYNQVFPRWDNNKDGVVTVAEIAEFRQGLGVPVEGTQPRPEPLGAGDTGAAQRLVIPAIDDLVRIDRNTRPSRDAMRNSAYVLKTKPHEPAGTRYVILTDHTEATYLKSLERLKTYRDGVILQVDDLALLHKDLKEFDRVRGRLRETRAQYLAIAPRMESFRENMMLGMWELISTIDDDPQLDAYPGVLLASDAAAFSRLIDRSISYRQQSSRDLRPFFVSQVPSTRELRSLQKSGILRNLFAEQGCKTPTVGVYSAQASGAPKLPGDLFWTYNSQSRGDLLRRFPADAAEHFQRASLIVMHGHGVPGMSCGVDIEAIPKEHSASIVLCGSCFSAAPKKSDWPAMRQAPGGYGVEDRDAFTVRIIDSGASVALGHMRLSQGFPHLFPVLESWMKGGSVGKAYQELINGLIELQDIQSGGFVVDGPSPGRRQPRQNLLLYVVLGDPAVRPFEAMIK